MSTAKIERIRIDVWASIRPVIEAEMNRTGLTANEVVNIALADYFGLTPSGRRVNTSEKLEPIKDTVKIEEINDVEDYI